MLTGIGSTLRTPTLSITSASLPSEKLKLVTASMLSQSTPLSCRNGKYLVNFQGKTVQCPSKSIYNATNYE